MSKATIRSEVLRPLGPFPAVRSWFWSVRGTCGSVVLQDSGYANLAAALRDALAAQFAVAEVEGSGHTLRPWDDLVDEAVI